MTTLELAKKLIEHSISFGVSDVIMRNESGVLCEPDIVSVDTNRVYILPDRVARCDNWKYYEGTPDTVRCVLDGGHKGPCKFSE